MLKTIAILFGIVLMAIGVLGFVPSANPDGLLFGRFEVNLAHNVVHLLTGIIALLAGLSSTTASVWFFRLFGLVYALVAIHGFVYGDKPVLGVMANNAADTWLHTAIALVSLLLGFCCCGSCSSSSRGN